MTPKQFKASILQLAIQGKLVPQNPNDEPASEVLKRIEAAKDAKSVKKGKSLPPITDDEKPFSIPDSWEWVRLGNVIHLLSGRDLAPSDYNDRGDGIVYVTGPSCLSDTGVLEMRWTTRPCAIASKGDVLLVCKGAGYGKNVICDIKEVHIARQIMAIKKSSHLEMGYVQSFLNARFDYIKKAGQGVIPGIDRDSVLLMLLPLPPLAEQKRIVAKVETLFKYVDECEDSRKELAEKLAETLKSSVLQEAIQGRLVPQDPNDEPASELLKRIAAQREKLVAEKKIKKVKTLPPIKDDEKPFSIPDSWEWVRLGEIVHYSMGKTPPRGDVKYWMDGEFNWVSITDMVADGHITETKEHVTGFAATTIFGNRISKPGTLLMSFKLTVGKVSILDISAFHNEAMISIYPFADIGNATRDYLFKVLPVLSQNGDTKSAIKGNTLNSNSLNNLLIPLPPLVEQKRIVAKVDSLLAKIEEVKGAVC